MQCAIDNAKRSFDIDLTAEIERIKKDMDIKQNGFPSFWKIIKKDFKDKNNNKINEKLICPMNYLYNIKLPTVRNTLSTLPMSTFYIKYSPTTDAERKRSKKVEALIEKYSLDLYDNVILDIDDDEKNNNYLLLRMDFEEMINDIKTTYISRNYLFLTSWLIDRALSITAAQKTKRSNNHIKSTLNKNRSLLLKVLYEINPENVLKVFSANVK